MGKGTSSTHGALRILQCTGALNMGGAETMLMNVYREINKEEFQFDFIVSGSDIGYYEKEAEIMGARIHHVAKRSESFLGHLMDLYRVIKTNKYGIVHFHTQNAFMTLTEVIVAKLAGTKTIIVHSHNTTDWRKGLLIRLHSICKPVLYVLSNIHLACGDEAGEWLYGKGKMFKVIPLPVNCKAYLYSEERYKNLREKYNIQDKKVYAHTGRFGDQKNHSFLIDIFAGIVAEEPESILFLMGDGELKSDIEHKVADLGLSDKVVFCGNVSDVNEKLIMSDVFLLPSKYEGFPTVALEAQAAGLLCLISDTITKEIELTDWVKFAPINAGVTPWVNMILSTKAPESVDRAKANGIIASGYDVKIVAQTFEQIYAGNKMGRKQ